MVEEKTTLVSEIGANLLKKEIVFTVPDSFDHESQLDLFQKKVENIIYSQD